MTEQPLPPHDEEHEIAVLGAMLLSPNAIREVVDIVNATDFYKPAHQVIFQKMIDMHGQGERPDPMTVAARLEQDHALDKVGEAPYLHTLMASCPTATNAAFYAEHVAGKAALRRLTEAGQRIMQLGYYGLEGADVATVLERARAAVDEATLSYRDRSHRDGVDFDELADAALERYTQPRPPGLPTGWADLDAILSGGLRPGTLTVIGARTGIGKSIMGINLAVEAARRQTGTLFASLEMDRDEVMDRIFAQLAGVELGNLTRHTLTDEDWRRIRKVREQHRGMPLRIEDIARLSITRLESLARDRTRHPAGLGLVVADYLQLMRAADPRVPRQEQVAGFSRGLKLLAKELRVPVVALAQLNRAVEQRGEKRPLLSDLRESGAVEQDSDVVMLLWDDPNRPGERQVSVAKNRQGRTGDVSLSWAPQYARARNLSQLRTVE